MKLIDLRVVSAIQVDVTRDLLDVTSLMPEPDPAWRMNDAAGHRHYYRSPRNPYPSLRYVIDAWGMDEDGERFVRDAHMECRICGEHVRPGTLVRTDRRYAAGPASWSAVVTIAEPPVVTMQELFEAVDSAERCHFLFSTHEGDGRLFEIFSHTGGYLRLTIHGTGPLTRNG